jgi:hypothetical protein
MTSSLPVESRNINERSDNGVFGRDSADVRVLKQPFVQTGHRHDERVSFAA